MAVRKKKAEGTHPVPKKGTKEKLVELALENARMVLAKDRERIRREEGRTIGAVHEVEEWLGLKKRGAHGSLRYFQYQWL